MTPITLEPPGRTDGLERLDLLDMDEIHNAVQNILRDIDARIRVQARPGRNSGRSWLLFSYRTFEPPPGAGIDPVVVGVSFSRGPVGVLVRGDVAGELSGDVLFDVPAREISGAGKIRAAAENVAEKLAAEAPKIAAALTDLRRRY